eukprot:485200-Amorphochlora_amoeboformis.AAC.1
MREGERERERQTYVEKERMREREKYIERDRKKEREKEREGEKRGAVLRVTKRWGIGYVMSDHER